MGFGFDGFQTMFGILFAVVIGLIVLIVGKGILTWMRNNHSPRLTVDARIVAKREDISHHHHANAGDITGARGFHGSTFTTYYVTFQVESGDRMELSVDGREYGLLAEGDIGKLTFQGTRYLQFERQAENG